MRNFVYPATLSPEKSGGVTVQFPDLPEAITSGKDRADAVAQAADCLDEAIAGRIVDGLEIPEPSASRRRQVPVPLPAPMGRKGRALSGDQGIGRIERRARPPARLR